MYPLLPWKWLASVLAVVVAAAVYADDLGRWVGVDVPDCGHNPRSALDPTSPV
jgi:hypothetical protein